MHNDKIRVLATKPDTTVDTYTWRLIIPEPMLISVDYNPGEGSPAFNQAFFEYILTLAPGATSTTTRVTKDPGALSLEIKHESQAAGSDVVICNFDECQFDTVSLQPSTATCWLCAPPEGVTKRLRSATLRTSLFPLIQA